MASGSLVVSHPAISSVSTGVLAGSVPTSTGWTARASTGSILPRYQRIIDQINASSGTILQANSLTGGSIALFEFVDPDAFFIGIDDGKGTANSMFARKILYRYDTTTYALTVTGIFDWDAAKNRYQTIYGANPYAKSQRVRITNPLYRGKILTAPTTASATTTPAKSPATSVSFVVSMPTTASGSTGSTSVTAADIYAAYKNNNFKDTVSLSDQYLVIDPNNISIRHIRYLSLLMIGRYNDALAEVDNITSIQGVNLDPQIACDGVTLAKYAKNSDEQARYALLCKK